jgi:tRNA (mo5U34)-methyltransferase
MSSSAGSSASLRKRVAAIGWYHTLELGEGVVTPGWFDHRSIVGIVPLPSVLTGARCLDVGTFNGLWAFEMERRGADEVLALDVPDPGHWDWPVGSEAAIQATLGERMAGGEGFTIAREALGSSVQRVEGSVYDLDPERHGRFDVVHLGSLLVHLRDPVGALERVRAVCAGSLIVVDGIDLPLTLLRPRAPLARLDGRGRPWWWSPNSAGLVRLVEAAGFELLRPPRRLFVPPGAGWSLPSRFDLRLLRGLEGRRALTAAWLGDPHVALLARPRL